MRGGGGICAMRGRATGRLCVVIRGVVSDAVLCLHNGVICDLPFNVVGLPKKMGGMIAHPSVVCQSPHAAFLRTPPLFFAHYFDLADWIDPINAAFKRQGDLQLAVSIVSPVSKYCPPES